MRTDRKYPVVLAVDPGATTGIAKAHLLPNPDDEPNHRVWPHQHQAFEVEGGIDGFGQWLAYIAPAIEENAHNVTWVVERFNISKQTVSTRIDYNALYIIGLLAGIHGLENLRMQMPRDRKPFLSQLDRLGWHTITKDNHANDASAHLLCHLTKTYPYLMEDLLG